MVASFNKQPQGIRCEGHQDVAPSGPVLAAVTVTISYIQTPRGKKNNSNNRTLVYNCLQVQRHGGRTNAAPGPRDQQDGHQDQHGQLTPNSKMAAFPQLGQAYDHAQLGLAILSMCSWS